MRYRLSGVLLCGCAVALSAATPQSPSFAARYDHVDGVDAVSLGSRVGRDPVRWA